jgi:hypothetical protein
VVVFAIEDAIVDITEWDQFAGPMPLQAGSGVEWAQQRTEMSVETLLLIKLHQLAN